MIFLRSESLGELGGSTGFSLCNEVTRNGQGMGGLSRETTAGFRQVFALGTAPCTALLSWNLTSKSHLQVDRGNKVFQTWRTPEEIAAAKEQEEADKLRASEEQKRLTRKVAEIEDRQRAEGVRRAAEANHPTDVVTPNPPQEMEEDEEGNESGKSILPFEPQPNLTSTPEDDDPNFDAAQADTSDSDEEEEAEAEKPRGRAPRASRDDVSAQRTPDVDTGSKRKAENKKGKKYEETESKQEGGLAGTAPRRCTASSASGRSSLMAVATDDDDRMVRPGALDDDPNEHIEAQKVVGGKGKKRGKQEASQPSPTSSRFRDRPRLRPSKISDKVAINGPPTTSRLALQFYSQKFSLPSPASKWGSSPILWASLLTPNSSIFWTWSFPAIGIRSRVLFGMVWYVRLVMRRSLITIQIAYRLNDWRNSIIARATTGVEEMLASKRMAQEEREKNPEPDEELDPLTYTRDGFINFKTPQGIAAFVAWATTETCPFHWREWNDGDAKEYYSASDYKPPIGALILAIQATQYALRAWSTGEFVVPSKATGFFSKDSYAGTTKMVNGVKKKHTRSSKYVPSIEAFDDDQWQAVFDRTNSWITAKKKKASSSRSSSMDVDRIEIESDEEEFSVPVSRESRLHS
ncbi:hypothetical protein DFH06DRAFT_1138725 [Mycena polygramma]|nr:hypothetical protein DFH06DRAFT_1138725 [Mycena polygramma]